MISAKQMRQGLLLVACAIALPCFGSTLTYTAVMSGSQETPPNASMGSGSATLTLTGNSLSVHEVYSGIAGAPTGAHIHCCAGPGVAGPIVIPFSAFPTTTAGTFDATFDLSTFAFTGGATETSFLAGLNAGLAYVNIHDATFPGGEIRGQLTAVTPEPGTLVLLGTGVVAGFGAIRRRLLRA